MSFPQTLERDAIARLIPHQGSMCLLDRLESWSAGAIHCSSRTHRDPANPMRSSGGLLVPCAIEYAAQAMALHGGLSAEGGSAPSAGYLASVRNVRFGVARLDTVEGALQLHAERTSGDARQVLYQFTVRDERGKTLADGRAIVVLNTPLPLEDESS